MPLARGHWQVFEAGTSVPATELPHAFAFDFAFALRPSPLHSAFSIRHSALSTMHCMTYLIGTSGYNYPEWRGTFYPEKFPTNRMLGFYAEHFNKQQDAGLLRGTLQHG
jgi:hypothetical protein